MVKNSKCSSDITIRLVDVCVSTKIEVYIWKKICGLRRIHYTVLCTADTRIILRQATENYMITAAEAKLATGLETTSQPDAVSRFASIISHSVQPLLYPELNIADGLVSRRLALIEDFMEAPII